MTGEEVAVDATDDAEFTEFMLGCWPRLVRLGYALTGDRGLGEDLAQTALAKTYASWPRIARAGDPEAYVRKIVVNASRDGFRRRRVGELLTDSPPEVMAGDAAPFEQRSALFAPWWLVAAVRPKVSYLVLSMTDGTTRHVPTVQVGSVRMYAIVITAGPRITHWAAYDASGHRLYGGRGAPGFGHR